MFLDPLIQSIYHWSDLFGVLLMGIIGGTIARKRGFDIVGFLFIAMFSALGGGMIRDVLLSRGTVIAMQQPEYLYLAFTGALIARFTYFKGTTWDRIEFHGDALVSALWAATGTVKAASFGLPIIPCIMMGVFTAVGGGMIRDICMGRVPAVFGDNTPSVLPAMACGLTVYGAAQIDHLAWGMVLGPLLSFGISTLAYWSGWRLSARQEWAPVNVTAAQVARRVEGPSRAVGRRLEPARLRAWRHKRMEAALQRRLERLNAEDGAAGGAGDALAGIVDAGVDGGADVGVDVAGDSYAAAAGRRALLEAMMDEVLADEELTDEVLAALERRRARALEQQGAEPERGNEPERGTGPDGAASASAAD
ncbi:trimeric intracellular cation channel family protein [uncultured Corynebacterium sp.]|uniref:trimeric intracellular cation channel family protein n=1 Tax=uncultured Corynebacterium sp. TaxID=159447 RepID=UPI0025FABAEC|nr:trimeric intracellular cation channel family protein [uncultured Corynebacterium sp.]